MFSNEKQKSDLFFYCLNKNIRDIKNILLMKKRNVTSHFSIMNQSIKSANIFQFIYHSIKDLIEAGEDDIFTVTGKILREKSSYFSCLKKKTKIASLRSVNSIVRIESSPRKASHRGQCLHRHLLFQIIVYIFSEKKKHIFFDYFYFIKFL